MENKFIEKIVTPILKIIAKIKLKERVISIFDIIKNAKSILIIMPDKLDDFGVARNYLKVIETNFPQAKMTIISREQFKNLLEQTRRPGTIFVTQKDRNIFTLPKKNLIKKITSSTYDIAIDMNQTFHLFSTYLCQESGAILRICLEDKQREPFYNFSFRSSVQYKLDNKYKNMLKYLSPKVTGIS
jgi:ADP-heptose:LPS heptosyltransferase